MRMAVQLNASGRNTLLALLPIQEHARLVSCMEKATFEQNHPVFSPVKAIEHVFFPLDSMASVVVDLPGGSPVEIGTIGNEGMTGLPLLLGVVRPANRAFFQVGGTAMRMTALDFTIAMDSDGEFGRLMRVYAQGYYDAVAQCAACNGVHSVEQRLCRWILLTQDRVGRADLPLTQDFIAMMLSVRRPSVSVVAEQLKRAGLIDYHRGLITVLDRRGLELTSCRCYGAIQDGFRRLLGIDSGRTSKRQSRSPSSRTAH